MISAIPSACCKRATNSIVLYCSILGTNQTNTRLMTLCVGFHIWPNEAVEKFVYHMSSVNYFNFIKLKCQRMALSCAFQTSKIVVFQCRGVFLQSERLAQPQCMRCLACGKVGRQRDHQGKRRVHCRLQLFDFFFTDMVLSLRMVI